MPRRIPSAQHSSQPTRTVTIRQIAAAAEVSIASVSRALNEQAGVGKATRARIEAIARQLGYTPDSRARALVTGEVPFFGLIVPDIANPFYAELARGAEQALGERGHSLLLVSTARQPQGLARGLELLFSRRVAGLLLAASVGDLPRPPWTRLRGSAVLVGQPVPRGAGLDAVDADDRHGGWLAGRHLIRLGWRRIAFVGGSEHDRSTSQRLAGLRQAIDDQPRSTTSVAAISFGGWTVDSGREQAAALLDRRGGPDAIFAANDLLALGVARAASDRGRRLGEDLALVGYDDIEPLRYCEVPISSVAQPKRELGARAVELLSSAGQRRRPRRIRLKPELVVRHSCGAAKTHPPNAPGGT